MEEMKKSIDVEIWNQDASIQYILSHVQSKPDFILFNDIHKHYSPIIHGIDKLDIPSGMIVHDLHYKPKYRSKLMQNSCFKILLPHYKEAFLKLFPSCEQSMYWFPHHVNEEVFKDHELVKNIDVLMVGAEFEHLYPMRSAMLKELNMMKGFKTYRHPGYRQIGINEKDIITGIGYAKEINRSKIFVTCHSIFKYPLLKYFEVLACNTLLLAPGSKELSELGFIDNETFVEIDKNNYKEKINYYLMNENERKRIALNGYKLIHSRHTTKIRANELINQIKIVIDRSR